MEQEQNQAFSENLENEMNKIEKLSKLFKKIIKSEEKMIKARNDFAEIWNLIQQQESQDQEQLKKLLSCYAQKISDIEFAHQNSVQHIKKTCQYMIDQYPDKIKQFQDQFKQTQKLQKEKNQEVKQLIQKQQKGNQKDIQNKIMQLQNSIKNKEQQLQQENNFTEQKFGSFETQKIQDFTVMMQHLISAQMHYHSSAINKLHEMFAIEIKKIEEIENIQNQESQMN